MQKSRGKYLVRSKFVPLFGLSIVLVVSSCGKVDDSSTTSATEDTSASGAAASAAGGALSSSSSGATQALLNLRTGQLLYACAERIWSWIPSAEASNACPTFRTTGAGCTAAGGTVWLAYSACSFGASAANWSGTQALTMSTGASAACGTFPNPGASASLVRQFVTAASSTTPGTATRTSAAGTVVTLDDATANLGNFDGHTIATIANSGYGTQVSFNGSGVRSSVTIARRVYSTGHFDHSVSGALTITETTGAPTRALSGSMSVYHNLLKVVGTSTFNSVTHSDTCCLPTAGTITTVFAAGASVTPTVAGSKLVGKSETLTFTGCGTGTLAGADGTTSNVTLSHCL